MFSFCTSQYSLLRGINHVTVAAPIVFHKIRVFQLALIWSVSSEEVQKSSIKLQVVVAKKKNNSCD